MVMELVARMSSCPTPDAIQESLDVVQSLIGFFDIDPNRTLDVLLELLIENVNLHHAFFIQLLEKSPWRKQGEGTEANGSIYSSLMGFKFSCGAVVGGSSSSTATPNIYIACALLIRHRFFSLSNILPYLTVDADSIQNEYDNFLAAFLDDVAVPNSSTTATSMNSEAAPAQGSESTDLNKNHATSSDSTSTNLRPSHNHRVHLCCALFQVGDWSGGMCLLALHPTFVLTSLELQRSMCFCIHWMVEVEYKKYDAPISIPLICFH